jgi:hypothetical protein
MTKNSELFFLNIDVYENKLVYFSTLYLFHLFPICLRRSVFLKRIFSGLFIFIYTFGNVFEYEEAEVLPRYLLPIILENLLYINYEFNYIINPIKSSLVLSYIIFFQYITSTAIICFGNSRRIKTNLHVSNHCLTRVLVGCSTGFCSTIQN